MKRQLCLLLTLCLLLSGIARASHLVFADGATDDAWLFGDINEDGVVDIDDILAVRQHMFGLEPLSPCAQAAALYLTPEGIDVDTLLAIRGIMFGPSAEPTPDPTSTSICVEPTPWPTAPDCRLPTSTPSGNPEPTPTATYNWPVPLKPVIYLYPTEVMDVTVQLDYNGVLDFTYPDYASGWSVTAYPDGTLINHADGLEYSYLFWEGHGPATYDWSAGFVVRGADTVSFLQEKLAYMGLTPREYNEFIVFWLPRMQNNAYNFITFQGDAYTTTAPLTVHPQPDSVLRVFMAFEPLTAPITVPPQVLSTFERKGFTLVEWGGTEKCP